MRILWASNLSVRSAYAFQAQMVIPRIQKMGHFVTGFDIRNGGGSTMQIGDMTVLPAFHDALGNDSLPLHFQRSKSDVVITLVDVWGLGANMTQHMPWFPITPIDHAPVPPAVRESLKTARGVIALSRFGQDELRKIGIDSWYMPHGVDPAVFYPALTADEQSAARVRMGLPADKFIVSFCGVNDSNPSRKGIFELLAAWSMFHATHRDSVLYMHTSPLGNIPLAGTKNGVDIDAIIGTLGIDPRSIILPDQYRLKTGIPATELADIMRGSDAFILPSRGEGFGVPLIEAQACGTPVITTNVAAGAELCASGWLIEGEDDWSWMNAIVLKPGIASINENLNLAYTAKGDLAYRRQAAEFARGYYIDFVAQKYLAPTLEQIAQTVIMGQKVSA